MSQIVPAARCLSIALVLVATFVTLSPIEQAAAKPRSQVENACYASGGEYYEYWLIYPSDQEFGVLAYGCFLPDGRDVECYDADGETACVPNPAPEPEDNVGDPPPTSWQPADGQVADQSQYAPAPSAPTGNSHSGYEYKMIER